MDRELELSLTTLREAFREREVTATLQCAGNRRAGLIAIRDIPGGNPSSAEVRCLSSEVDVALLHPDRMMPAGTGLSYV